MGRAAGQETVPRPPRGASPVPGTDMRRRPPGTPFARPHRARHAVHSTPCRPLPRARPAYLMSPVSIAAVGDLQLGDSAICVGYGLHSRYPDADGARRLFGETAEWLDGADIVFGNLECVLAARGAGDSALARDQMRGAPAYAEVLREQGFTVLNVANNHAMQHGELAFQASVARLREAGIVPIGLKGEGPWSSAPHRLTARDGTRVGIVGWSRRPRQYGHGPVPYAQADDATIRADVARLAAEVDHVVVSLHWGEEFVTQPSEGEVAFARSLVDAGARLILGHHPHVARPVERHGDALIVYSLGNYVADMVWYDVLRHGLLLRCRLDDAGATLEEGWATFIGDDFVPRRAARPGVTPVTGIAGLPPDEYDAAVRATVREQQLASYRFAAANVARYRPSVLGHMVWATLRNKVSGALAR